MIAETYRDLITDFNHWAFEWTVEVVSTLVAFLVGKRWWLRWQHQHDVEVHGIECDTHDH